VPAKPLITGVAMSVAKAMDDLVTESGSPSDRDGRITSGSPIAPSVPGRIRNCHHADQIVQVRRFVVDALAVADRLSTRIGTTRGGACPMATGVSHHISPYGDIEPCPIIQFARETIHDKQGIFQIMTELSSRRTSADRGESDAGLCGAGAAGPGPRTGSTPQAPAIRRSGNGAP
jgi:hypothetical protein